MYILMLFYLSDVVDSYFKEHKGPLNVSAKGKVSVNAIIYFASFRNVPYYNCDEGQIYPYFKCDPRIRQSVVIPGQIASEQKLNADKQGLESAVLGKHYMAGWERRSWLNFGYEICPYHVHEWDNVNVLTNTFSTSSTSDNYYQTVIFCTAVNDMDSFWKTEYLIEFCKYAFYPIIGVGKHLIGSVERTYSTMNYLVTPLCQQSYYENSCWKYCHSVRDRYYCDAKGNEICLNYYDFLIYTYTFRIPSELYKTWELGTVSSHRCSLINSCVARMDRIRPKCRDKDYRCYPTGNITFTCLLFTHSYLASKYSMVQNATFDTILNGEYVKFDIGLVGRDNDLVKNNSLCSWNIPVYDIGYTSFDITGEPSILKVREKAMYNFYNFSINCTIGQFHTFAFNKSYFLFISFTEITVMNISFEYKRYLFIGQIIYCVSNAVPLNASNHKVAIIVIGNQSGVPDIPFASRVMIPLNLDITFLKITCLHEFQFTGGRPKINKSRSFNFEVRAFMHFGWKRKYKNIYTIYQSAGCDYSAYFIGKILVKKLTGISSINTVSGTNFSVYTESGVGGIYRFLCSLEILQQQKYSYRTLLIEIYNIPTFICIQALLPNPGSFIFCNHNGYPADHAYYTMSLYIDNKEITSTYQNYIKIPFSIPQTMIKVVCRFTFFLEIDKHFFRSQLELEVLRKTSTKVVFSTKDLMCMRYMTRQIDNIYERSNMEIIVIGEIMFLKKQGPMNIDMWLGVFLFISAVTVLLMVVMQLNILEHTYEIMKVIVRMRRLDDQLTELSKLVIDGRLAGANFMQYKMSNLGSFDSVF